MANVKKPNRNIRLPVAKMSDAGEPRQADRTAWNYNEDDTTVLLKEAVSAIEGALFDFEHVNEGCDDEDIPGFVIECRLVRDRLKVALSPEAPHA